MSRCRHRDRRGYSLVDFYLADGTLAGAFDGHRLFRGRCPRCGDISLGPATDTPETAVEVHAARIVASEDALTAAEWSGWAAYQYGEPTPMGAHKVAGWLAAAIYFQHKETP